jgi:hypothetical protein
MRTPSTKDCREKYDDSQDWPSALDVIGYLLVFYSFLIIWNVGPVVIEWMNKL